MHLDLSSHGSRTIKKWMESQGIERRPLSQITGKSPRTRTKTRTSRIQDHGARLDLENQTKCVERMCPEAGIFI